MNNVVVVVGVVGVVDHVSSAIQQKFYYHYYPIQQNVQYQFQTLNMG